MDYKLSRNNVLWEINLKDLFWKVIFSWRFICICSIAIAVLAVGFSYINDLRQYRKSLESSKPDNITKEEVTIDELKQSLTQEEVEALEEIEVVKKQIQQKEEYKENSLLMQINPDAADVVTLFYYINTHYEINLNGLFQTDKAPIITDAYLYYLQSRSFQTDLAKALNYDGEVQYLGELVSAVKTNSSDNTFYVHVYGLNEDHANEMAKSIENLLEQYKDTLNEEVTEFDLVLLNKRQEVILNSSLLSNRDSINSAIISYKKTLNNLEKQLNKKQLQVYTGIAESEGTSAQNAVAIETAKPGLEVKTIVLGIILGIFLSVVIVVFKYLFTGKLRNVNELGTIFGIFSLGNYNTINRTNAIDRLLIKIRYGLFDEKISEYIVANLKLSCQNKGIEHICLVSTVKYSHDNQEKLNEIKKNLEGAGIKVLLGEGVLENANVYEQVVKCGNVVIVEKENDTLYANLEKVFRMYDEHKVNILGYIGI